jgi:polyisoprenoid-binding protein YceI
MKSSKQVAIPSRAARRRVEHEAEGGGSGVLAEAVVGTSTGSPRAIAGAIIGGVAGALVGAAMDHDCSTDDEDADAALRPSSEGVSFQVRHFMGAKVNGKFTRWRGFLAFDEEAPQKSRIEVVIDAASIDTNEPLRDAHLRSVAFLDVEKYPNLVFKSTKIEPAGDRFKLTGNLTMHGVTKPITLDIEYADRGMLSAHGPGAGFLARGSLHRKDWGLTWSQALDVAGLAVGSEIEICLGIAATKAS